MGAGPWVQAGGEAPAASAWETDSVMSALG